MQQVELVSEYNRVEKIASFAHLHLYDVLSDTI